MFSNQIWFYCIKSMIFALYKKNLFNTKSASNHTNNLCINTSNIIAIKRASCLIKY